MCIRDRAIGATVVDILPLETLLPKLDEKHEYVAVIFAAVKQNGSFELTDEQRAAAYEAYRKARQTTEAPEAGQPAIRSPIDETVD